MIRQQFSKNAYAAKIIIFSWLSILLLGGCVSTHYQSEAVPKTVADVLIKTDALTKQQRWGEALYVLKQSIKVHPEEQQLQDKLIDVNNQWTEVKRRLEDWILVYEVESLLSQRPLVVSMSQSKPDDYYLKLRLKNINTKLNARRNSLIRCTEYQLNKVMKLARRCIESARRVEVTENVKSLLNQIDLQLFTQQQDINEKNQDINERNKLKNAKLIADNKAAYRANKIMLARSQLQAQLYYEALMLLEPLLADGQPDQEVAMLIDEAMTGRDLQVLQLISHGDKLYRKEKTLEAIRIWQQASRLDPKNSSIKRRIERARKVMENLEEFSS